MTFDESIKQYLVEYGAAAFNRFMGVKQSPEWLGTQSAHFGRKNSSDPIVNKIYGIIDDVSDDVECAINPSAVEFETLSGEDTKVMLFRVNNKNYSIVWRPEYTEDGGQGRLNEHWDMFCTLKPKISGFFVVAEGYGDKDAPWWYGVRFTKDSSNPELTEEIWDEEIKSFLKRVGVSAEIHVSK